ncbi:MAG: site-specific integrase [Chitinophagaceae bacterium]
MNTSVKVLLYTSKILSNGEHPVMLRVIKGRKIKYLSVGFSCSKDLWDLENNIPKKKHEHYKRAKILIGKKKLDAERLIMDLENDGKNLSVHEIKSKLKKEKVSNPLIMDYFEIIIKRLIDNSKIKNSEIYKDTKRNLSYFINGKPLHFSDIDIEFLNKFEDHLIKNGKGGNTIFIYMRTLRALINKAINEGYCNEKYYSFKRFSLSKYSRIKTAKRAISKEDINKIKELNLSKHKNLIDAKNIFLFSYYCRGMNFTDLVSLKWKDIKSGKVIYKRQKTEGLFTIKLLLPAQEILEFYKPLTFEGKESYIFPILNQNHNTAQSIFNRKVKMLRKINANLKEIAELAGIETILTTYVARHTYATVLKKSGISISIISEAMGHDSEKTTQIYLDSFGDNILDEASKSIL